MVEYCNRLDEPHRPLLENAKTPDRRVFRGSCTVDDVVL